VVNNHKPGILDTGINLTLQFKLTYDIELYHRMRFLLLKSNKYAYEHDSMNTFGKIVLTEIGSLIGRSGSFNIFGLLYTDASK